MKIKQNTKCIPQKYDLFGTKINVKQVSISTIAHFSNMNYAELIGAGKLANRSRVSQFYFTMC